MSNSSGSSRTWLRRAAGVVGIAGTALLSVAVVQHVTSAAPSDIVLAAPERVYTGVNQDLAFTGTDSVSNNNRVISVSDAVPGTNCDTSPGVNYSIDDCPRVQLDLTTSNGAGLLYIPGITSIDPDNNVGTDNDTLATPSGAIVDQSTDPAGGPGLVLHLNGTQTQLNAALETLTFIPSTDYEERESAVGSLPSLKIIAVQGDATSSVTMYTTIKVEGTNDAPSISTPAFPVSIAAGSTNNAIADVSVTDDDMCNLTICGGSYTNPGKHETDDKMLLLMWLPDSACGTFYTGNAVFSTKGGASNTSVSSMLTAEGITGDAAVQVAFSMSPTGYGLDLSSQPGSVLDETQVYAGIGSLSEVRYALSSLKYNAPAGDMTCLLNIEVNDLGNNGTPHDFIGGAEVPDPEGNQGSVELTVYDAHPDVTIYQFAPGSLGDYAGPNKQAQFTIQFDQEIEESSFTIADIDTRASTATGVVLDSLVSNGDGMSFSVLATATGDGVIAAEIPAGGVFAAGHDGDTDFDNEASGVADNEITWDQTAPIVGVGWFGSPPDPVTTSPLEFKVVVSDDNIDTAGQLTDAELELGGTAGATLAVISATADPTEFKVSVSGMTQDGDVTLKVKAGAYVDDANNSSAASGIYGVNWDQPAVDTINPNVAVALAAYETDPAYGSGVDFAVTFDEVVTDFETVDPGDVIVGGTAGATSFAISGSGMVYSVTATGMTQSGTITLTVLGAVAIDGAGNPNNAALNTASVNYVFDETDPTVTVTKAAGQGDPTSTSPIVFDVEFSEVITGFEVADLLITSTAGSVVGAITNSGDDMNFTVEITGMSQDGDVTLVIPAGSVDDLSLNENTISTSADDTVAWQQVTDTTHPTVTVEQALGQADPTSTSPIVFDVVFSEQVTGFADDDLDITSTAGTVSGTITNSVSNTSFTVEITGMSQAGDVTLSVPADSATDAATNGNLASTSVDGTVAWQQVTDTTNPTVTVEQAVGQGDPTSTSPIVFDVVFSEPVTGFIDADLGITSTAGAVTGTVTNSGDDTNFTVEITGMSQDGDITLALAADAAQDAAANGSEASTSIDNVVAWLQSSSSLSQGTPGGTVTVTATGGNLTSFSWQTPSPSPPAGWLFPYGMLTFSATTDPGALVTFTLTLPAPVADYMKLDGTWSSFAWNGETGAQISGNTVTVTIRDNGRGDSNATSGLVTDPGAPAVAADGGGGGGGDIPVTGSASELPLQIGALLLLLGGTLWLASRPRRTA